MITNSIEKYTKNMMKNFINKNSVVIDATCGNGIDTEFLAMRSKHVYAFDIQEEAIISTKNRCKDYTNITYFNDTHANISNLINDSIDLIIFNLGYLPSSESKISTNSVSTIEAIKASLSILKINGAIIITVYVGHDKNKEGNDLLSFVQNLNKYEYLVSCYQMLNLNNSPYTIIIEKK